MTPQNALPEAPKAPGNLLSVALRVAFFIAAVTIGLLTFAPPLVGLFGPVVAGTIGLCATGLVGNLLTMRIFDRRPLVDIGLHVNRSSVQNGVTGVALGGGTAALMLVAPLVAGTGHLVARPEAQADYFSLLFYLFALFVAAMGEELIFRGYAFQLLVQNLGPFATILPVSVIFGFLHSTNPNSTRLGVANTMLWGILLGVAFLRSRDLWLPIGLHFGWNAVLPLFGVNLSGITIDVTRYSYRWDLAPIWSGGSYGPEGGLLATIFIIALFAVFLRVKVKVQVAGVATNLNEPVWDD